MLAAVMLQVLSTCGQAQEPVPAADSAAAAAEATGGRGADIADECAGTAARPVGFCTTIRLFAKRRMALPPLISGRFPLGEMAQAPAASERPEHLKIALDVP